MYSKKINEQVAFVKLGGMDSNIYVVESEVVVDTGTGLHAGHLKKAFSLLGISPESIKRIVNTHAHFDHIGGNSLFKNAKVLIHEKDAPVLEEGNSRASCAVFFNSNLPKSRVDVRLKDSDTIKAGGVKLKVLHTPGHTEGSICLLDARNKILFTGDTLFSDSYGRTDLIGGSAEEMKSSLKKLSALEIDKILPGHGAIVSKNGAEHIKKILKMAQRG